MPRIDATTASTCSLAIAAIAAVATPAFNAHAQDALQWTEAEGGNGHWYRVVFAGGTGFPPNAISWDDARIAAQLQNGDLATPVTQAENEWLYAYAVRMHA